MLMFYAHGFVMILNCACFFPVNSSITSYKYVPNLRGREDKWARWETLGEIVVRWDSTQDLRFLGWDGLLTCTTASLTPLKGLEAKRVWLPLQSSMSSSCGLPAFLIAFLLVCRGHTEARASDDGCQRFDYITCEESSPGRIRSSNASFDLFMVSDIERYGSVQMYRSLRNDMGRQGKMMCLLLSSSCHKHLCPTVISSSFPSLLVWGGKKPNTLSQLACH